MQQQLTNGNDLNLRHWQGKVIRRRFSHGIFLGTLDFAGLMLYARLSPPAKTPKKWKSLLWCLHFVFQHYHEFPNLNTSSLNEGHWISTLHCLIDLLLPLKTASECQISNSMWSPRRPGRFPKSVPENVVIHNQLRRKGEELDKPCVFAIVLLTVQSSVCELSWGQNAQDNDMGFPQPTGTVLPITERETASWPQPSFRFRS